MSLGPSVNMWVGDNGAGKPQSLRRCLFCPLGEVSSHLELGRDRFRSGKSDRFRQS